MKLLNFFYKFITLKLKNKIGKKKKKSNTTKLHHCFFLFLKFKIKIRI